MAKITVNPISNNYSINVTNSSYCTVAMPITACWGPAYEDPDTTGKDPKVALEDTVWTRFNSTQAGLQSFVATFRGPASNYRRAKDYSYQTALSLISNGYDVLVCRLCPGTASSGHFSDTADMKELTSEPTDWEDNYATYYTKDASLQFVHVSGVEVDNYELLTVQPTDWATNYNHYYTKSGDEYNAVEGVVVDKYISVPGDSAPAFATDTYYKLESDEYVLLSEEPADWSTNWADYYQKDGTETVAPAFAADTYYKKDGTKLIAPDFETGKYYEDEGVTLDIKAKYPGTFGNNLIVTINKITSSGITYWNAIVYAVDSSNIRTSLENLTFVFDVDNATDNILHISEVESNYIIFTNYKGLSESSTLVGSETSGVPTIQLAGGSDTAAQNAETDTPATVLAKARTYALERYLLVASQEDIDDGKVQYLNEFTSGSITDINVAYALRFREWTFTAAIRVFDLLKDKLTYNPNRVISPWDDQNFYEFGEVEPKEHFFYLSPMHVKLMDVAYNSRCATGLLDVPKSLARDGVWNDSTDAGKEGYVQKLCRYMPSTELSNATGLFTSASALFAPWGQYTYVGTSRPAPATPSFLALMITRAMILNQANQYEWALPTIRKTNFNLGKLDYTIPEDLLDKWQSREGCRVNVITNLPEVGAGIWGNSTLFEVPPATYQALANLSTRYIFNAIQDVVYRVGIGITYQYSNANAYDRFYAGVTPILDSMSNLGALVKGADVPGRDDLDDPGYYVTMAADINGLDSVNANSVIGKIIIRTAGVIEDITIDLIALPQSAALTAT